VPAGQPSFLYYLGESARHVGVVGFAHHPLGHAEEDVVLLKVVLSQQRDVLLCSVGPDDPKNSKPTGKEVNSETRKLLSAVKRCRESLAPNGL
jgi:hypothetical protein